MFPRWTRAPLWGVLRALVGRTGGGIGPRSCLMATSAAAPMLPWSCAAAPGARGKAGLPASDVPTILSPDDGASPSFLWPAERELEIAAAQSARARRQSSLCDTRLGFRLVPEGAAC